MFLESVVVGGRRACAAARLGLSEVRCHFHLGKEPKSEQKVDHPFLSRTDQTGLDSPKMNQLELLWPAISCPLHEQVRIHPRPE